MHLKNRIFIFYAIPLLMILLGSIFFLPSQGLANQAQSYGFSPSSALDQTHKASVLAQDSDPADKVVIYFFWGEGCPHCAIAKPVLMEMADQNPRIEFKDFEVYSSPVNQEILKQMAAAYGFEPRVVPTIMLADRHWEGFNDSIESEIKTSLEACLTVGCTDLGADVLSAFTTPETTAEASNPPIGSTPSPMVTEAPTPEQTETGTSPKSSLNLPLIGTIDLSGQSILVSTLLIAFVDGFNPCSIWVLTMLLSITLHTGSRKKILIVGLVFISVTALIYALFIAGLFTIFTVISFVGWIQVVVALVALFFGLINIKDYFWYKEGISFTIDDKSKLGLYKRMRRITDAGDSLWGLIGGTIILAAGVSLVEFSCTAGFPVLWTNLLTSQQVTAMTFIVLLLVYMLVYQLDELGIFLVAVFTLKSNKIEEKHGRILKLIGGMLMITLAGVMLVKPSLMSDLGSSLIIFGIAFGATLLMLLLHRVTLPRLGIRIGTEMTKNKKKRSKGKSKAKNATK